MTQNPSKLFDVPSEWNRLSEAVIGAAIDVHKTLGPGLLERLYEQAMVYELLQRQIPFRQQHRVAVSYKNAVLGETVLDLVVGDVLVVELKSVEKVSDLHLAQLVTYLRTARLPLGLLINFNCTRLKDGLYRRVLSNNTPSPACFHSDHTPLPSAASAFALQGGGA